MIEWQCEFINFFLFDWTMYKLRFIDEFLQSFDYSIGEI